MPEVLDAAPRAPPILKGARMAWRVARSLDVLLAQLNAAYPNRSKVSDGSIGDTNHQAEGWTNSDHNPWYGPGVVTARDYTHDPVSGLDIGRLSDTLAASRDSRIKYIIANGWILDSRPGCNPWEWIKYTGSNPHDHHLHLSVMDRPSCDDTRAWNLSAMPIGEEDMQKDERDVLFDLRMQLTGSTELGKYPGWPARPDTTPSAKSLVDYIRALHAEQRAQRQILDQIMVKLNK